MNKGYIKIPRELFFHPSFIGARAKHQIIFLWCLEKAAFTDSTYNDNGSCIVLKSGQFCFTQRSLAESINQAKHLANRRLPKSEMITPDDVRGCMAYFTKCCFLTQSLPHTKSVITFTFPGINEVFNIDSPAVSPATVPQLSPINKEDKEDKKYKEKDIPNGISKRKTAEPLSAQNQKISYREYVQLTEGEHGKLSQELGTETLEEYLDILNAHKAANGKKYKSDYHTMVKGGWVRKAHQERLERSPKVENKRITFEEARKERVRQLFRHGEFYNGAECILSDRAISFTRGMTHYELKFKEYGFEDQFESILRKLHIPMQKHV